MKKTIIALGAIALMSFSSVTDFKGMYMRHDEVANTDILKLINIRENAMLITQYYQAGKKDKLFLPIDLASRKYEVQTLNDVKVVMFEDTIYNFTVSNDTLRYELLNKKHFFILNGKLLKTDTNHLFKKL